VVCVSGAAVRWANTTRGMIGTIGLQGRTRGKLLAILYLIGLKVPMFQVLTLTIDPQHQDPLRVHLRLHLRQGPLPGPRRARCGRLSSRERPNGLREHVRSSNYQEAEVSSGCER